MGIVPITAPIALGLLLAASWLSNGSAPSAPQTMANQAYRQLWASHTDGPEGAIRLFRQALKDDPAFPFRWSDLGDALAASGDRPAAEYCFRRAVILAPQSPQIAMRAANFRFGEGDRASGLRLTGAVLRMTPDYNAMVFNSWLRLGGDVNTLLTTGARDDAAVAGNFFRFLLTRAPSSESDEETIAGTWAWLERNSDVTPQLATDWADWLIARHREREALPVWKRYVTRDSAWGVTNWIDNAGFETIPSGRGFDWRVSECAGVKTGVDATGAHSGRSSLRLVFDGTQNVDFRNVTERVSPPPGHYRLAAWIRTENLSTDQGVGLTFNGVSTVGLGGTHEWTEVSSEVTVNANAPVSEVQVVRQRSWRFDSKPRGVVWIDDVSLRRIDGK